MKIHDHIIGNWPIFKFEGKWGAARVGACGHTFMAISEAVVRHTRAPRLLVKGQNYGHLQIPIQNC